MKSVPAKIRAVLDTNTVISALVFGGTPRQVTDVIAEKSFRPVMAEEMLTELKRVVSKKFPQAKTLLDAYEMLLRLYAIWVPLGDQTIVISRDPDDDKFIEAALRGKCQYIISGDKDLLDLKEYKGIKIVSAAKFLELLGKDS